MLSSDLLSDIFVFIQDGILLLNKEREILLWNPWLERMSGLKLERVLKKKIETVFPVIKNTRIDFAIDNAIRQNQIAFISHTLHPKMFPLREINPRTGRFTGILHNITIQPLVSANKELHIIIYIKDETKNAEKEKILKERAEKERVLNQKLKQEIEERLRKEERLKLKSAIIQNATEGIIITDRATRIEFVNPAFTAITGFAPEDAIGKQITILQSGLHNSDYYKGMWETLSEKGEWRGEFINRKRDGEIFIVESSIIAVANESGETTNYVSIFRNITRRKKDEELLKKISRTDTLTGLANRRVFNETMERIWKSCVRNSVELAMVIFDVDEFKQYNDFYGHQAGDKCLMQIADAMAARIKRPDDLLGRLGGEEFYLILPYTTTEGAFKLVEKIRKDIEALSIPHEKSNVNKYVTVSAGVSSIVPNLLDNQNELIERADKALYCAKRAGRNQTCVSHDS